MTSLMLDFSEVGADDKLGSWGTLRIYWGSSRNEIILKKMTLVTFLHISFLVVLSNITLQDLACWLVSLLVWWGMHHPQYQPILEFKLFAGKLSKQFCYQQHTCDK